MRADVRVGRTHLEIIPSSVVGLANHGRRLMKYDRRLSVHDRWPVYNHGRLMINDRRSVKEYRRSVENNIRSVKNFRRRMVNYWRAIDGNVFLGTFHVFDFLMLLGSFLGVFVIK
jgi:hypothetical protein